MKKRLGQGLYILSLIFLAFGLFIIGWLVWPTPREAVSIDLPGGLLPAAPTGKPYASLAEYALSVSWPRWLRSGENGRVAVTLSESQPARDNLDDREVQVVIAETSLGSLPVDPSGQIQTSLGAGQDLVLAWSVSGEKIGNFPGEVIISFGFYDEALSELVAIPVAVVDININVISLFGLERGMLIWLGIISMILWGALFILGRVVQG